MEIVKFTQVYFLNWDKEMYYAPTNCPFQCRALNITEDLGQIQYVFSDKTGTLTENEMIFRCCSVGGINYTHTLTGWFGRGLFIPHCLYSFCFRQIGSHPQVWTGYGPLFLLHKE